MSAVSSASFCPIGLMTPTSPSVLSRRKTEPSSIKMKSRYDSKLRPSTCFGNGKNSPTRICVKPKNKKIRKRPCGKIIFQGILIGNILIEFPRWFVFFNPISKFSMLYVGSLPFFITRGVRRIYNHKPLR